VPTSVFTLVCMAAEDFILQNTVRKVDKLSYSKNCAFGEESLKFLV